MYPGSGRAATSISLISKAWSKSFSSGPESGSTSSNPFVHTALHPHRAATITSGEHRLGVIGELHPDTAAAFGISWPADRWWLKSIWMRCSLARPPVNQPKSRVPRFLPVQQDFAIVVGTETPSAAIEAALRQGGGPLVSRVVLFDVYEGEQIGAGQTESGVQSDVHRARPRVDRCRPRQDPQTDRENSCRPGQWDPESLMMNQNPALKSPLIPGYDDAAKVLTRRRGFEETELSDIGSRLGSWTSGARN